mmetsp:Transcript_24465/g.63780  ORF Transcript_24465/g.63780 Transcript_24465/m.63780 type:complete len:110 (+) Transcript_24465:1689-2018(+)
MNEQVVLVENRGQKHATQAARLHTPCSHSYAFLALKKATAVPTVATAPAGMNLRVLIARGRVVINTAPVTAATWCPRSGWPFWIKYDVPPRIAAEPTPITSDGTDLAFR